MIKRYEQFLLERKNIGLIYHYTNLSNLFGILQTDMLKAVQAYNNSVSFTRDGHFHYTSRPSISGTMCRLVIDGEKLSDRYAIKPHTDFTTAKASASFAKLRDVESEERVIGDIVGVDNCLVGVDLIRAKILRRDIARLIEYSPEFGDYLWHRSETGQEFMSGLTMGYVPVDELKKAKSDFLYTFSVGGFSEPDYELLAKVRNFFQIKVTVPVSLI